LYENGAAKIIDEVIESIDSIIFSFDGRICADSGDYANIIYSISIDSAAI